MAWLRLRKNADAAARAAIRESEGSVGSNEDVKQRAPSPEKKAFFLSRVLLLWMAPLVWRGWKKPLVDDDLPELIDEERGAYTTTRLQEAWDRNIDLVDKKGNPKANLLMLCLRQNHVHTLIRGGLLKALDIALAALQPILINRLLVFLQTPDIPRSRGFIWAAMLFVAPFLKTLVENHYFFTTMRNGMTVRSALQGLLYRKSLTMSPSARASATVGEVVNLMQLDAQRTADFSQFVHILWGAPVQIIVTVALLFNFIGVSAVFGLLMTIFAVPFQAYLMSIAIRLRARGISIADTRVKLMNEILQGIKAVKFYAWEVPFSNQVSETREKEISCYRQTIVVRSAFITLMMTIPTVIAVGTFAFFAGVFKQELRAENVFTGIALLNQLRSPVLMLPMVVNGYIDAKLALKRCERFLRLEDTDDHANDSSRESGTPGQDEDTTASEVPISDHGSSSSSSMPARGGADGVLIAIEDGEFSWGKATASLQEAKGEKKKGLLSSCLPKRGKRKPTEGSASADKSKTGGPSNAIEESVPDIASARDAEIEATETADGSDSPNGSPFLTNLNLRFEPGTLTAIVGRVGAGKSSLVSAVLGEMKKLNGEVTVKGSVAYVAQSAWIFNDTLRNNILFGKAYDAKRYREAIRVSALQADIDILPDHDLTAIGEKGINLSGGQKQRVSIARAVYANADIYIFDDPMSALDAHVGQYVFDNCVSNSGILRSKLRILVTNQLTVLPSTDNIVMMKSGKVLVSGPYDQVLGNAEFRSLADEVDRSNNVEENEDEKAPAEIEGEAPQQDSLAASIKEISKDGASISKEAGQESKSKAEEADDAKKKGKDLMQEEERLTGNVVVRAYYSYAVACGGVFLFLIALVLYIASVISQVLANWWLVFWSDAAANETTRPLIFFIGIYFALGVLYSLLTFIRSVFFLWLALQAAEKLHNTMLHRVLRAPMSFFDTTPIGRIISRFSRDVNAVDQLLPQAFAQMLATVLNLLASYIYIATVLPIFIAVAVPTTLVYILLQRFYNRTSIELKRLDSISKSPIYAHFSETLGGLSTIRAYHKQKQFRAENMKMIDINQRAYFQGLATNRWFSFYLEVFGSVLVFATGLLAVFTRGNQNGQTAAAIGLSLTYALQVTSFLGFTVRSITDLELQMNSVERMDYYGQKLPQEAPAKRFDQDGEPVVPADWPQRGAIDVNNVELRYRDGLDLVLKGMNLKIGAGENVGVVGRTGSGKSTLMIALLRLVELAGGSITVDGVNLADIGLDDVRSRITIIPQDPVIFSGTIRLNLDPFGLYSEAELWDALEKSHLKEYVQDFDGGLDAKVSEYGENLSAGQRQLICLTRALLRKCKVLIMDEASSSLDYETDRLLQDSIQKHMADATTLTIAHRLWTLTKCDKILVVKEGVVAEYDTPEALLARDGGDLRFLVDSMGEEGAERFRDLVYEHARLVGRMS